MTNESGLEFDNIETSDLELNKKIWDESIDMAEAIAGFIDAFPESNQMVIMLGALLFAGQVSYMATVSKDEYLTAAGQSYDMVESLFKAIKEGAH